MRPSQSAVESPSAYAQLLSLAVHEFRTPASVVSGYLRMLQREPDNLTERQRHIVDEAEKACTRLVSLIGELSEVAKLDAGQASFKRESFDLFRLVREVADGVHEGSDRDVHLKLHGESAGAEMVGDLPRIRAALDACIRAVLREQPATTKVVADCRRVRDNGNDAAVVVVARDSSVQTAFEAPRAPFDEKRGGLGLALPIAKRVVERHNGTISSPPSGDGDDAPALRSAVILTFPLSEPSR
jgi:signal transduction histidine kinase